MCLVVIPTPMVERIDKHVADFRAAFPDASDADASEIRQQLVNTFAEFGYLPEFEIVPAGKEQEQSDENAH